MWTRKQPVKLLKLVIKFAMMISIKSLQQNIKVSNTVVMK